MKIVPEALPNIPSIHPSILPVVLLLLSASALAADTPKTVSGRVFLDANANGKLDEGEKPFPDVRVTDGVTTVVTDQTGVYRITIGADPIVPYRPARTVSVCWPDNTWPVGRWWFRLSEIRNPAAVDFALRADKQTASFTFTQISDDHGNGASYPVFGKEVSRMGPRVKFCINTGDLGYAGLGSAAKMFTSIQKNAAAFPVPMLIVPGNHEFIGQTAKATYDSHDLVGWGAYTKWLGPIRWSFDYGGCHFVGMDYMRRDGNKIGSGPGPVAVRWLADDLSAVKDGRRIFLFIHYPSDGAGLYNLLAKHKVSFVYGGHTHLASRCLYGGTPGITNYSLATTVVGPKGFNVSERVPADTGKHGYFGTGIARFRSVVRPVLVKRRLKHDGRGVVSLSGRELALRAGPCESAEIQALVRLGKAKRAGIRIGEKKTVDVAFDGKTLFVAGAEIPYSLPPGTRAPLLWHVLADRDRLTLVAGAAGSAEDLFGIPVSQTRLRITRAVDIDNPGRVTLTADGAARFEKIDVWSLKPIANPKSRGLHHFVEPGWKWGTGIRQKMLLGESDPSVERLLRMVGDEGMVRYGGGR